MWGKPFFLFLLGILLGIFFLILPFPIKKERASKQEIPILTTGKPELCLLCHQEKIQEKAHSVEMLGCSSCHLGNPLASSKKLAHKGIVKNPSDLRVVEKTCGQPNCHPADTKKVTHSLMATNHGIIRKLLLVFEEEKLLNSYPKLSVAQLYNPEEPLKKSLALDYFKKLCGSCHLYLQKEKFEDFLGEKGGGCSACHLLGNKEDLKKKKVHPMLAKKIPLDKCVMCHNRSGRIGFTYQGLYEGVQGGIYSKVWKDGRELIQIEPDIHYKANLHCIDCHTREEVMGDGSFYKNIDQAIEISCESCHTQQGLTKRGKKLAQVVVKEGKLYLKGKITEKDHPIKEPSPECKDPLHKRLSCSACHSKYIPQCMGCHVKYDPREKHLDKILVRETKGLWDEYESYRRITEPPLAIKNNQIVPVSPG